MASHLPGAAEDVHRAVGRRGHEVQGVRGEGWRWRAGRAWRWTTIQLELAVLVGKSFGNGDFTGKILWKWRF